MLSICECSSGAIAAFLIDPNIAEFPFDANVKTAVIETWVARWTDQGVQVVGIALLDGKLVYTQGCFGIFRTRDDARMKYLDLQAEQKVKMELVKEQENEEND